MGRGGHEDEAGQRQENQRQEFGYPLALTSQGLEGGVLQMLNHGLTTGALFLLVGMIYERRHTRRIADYGGLQKVMPWFAGFFLLTAFASIGLPGLNGFVGEFLILLGSYSRHPILAVLAAFGVVLAAVYVERGGRARQAPDRHRARHAGSNP